jgi:hypothetical protein
MKTRILYLVCAVLLLVPLGACAKQSAGPAGEGRLSYPIVDTGQKFCYEDGPSIPCPAEGEPFHGQDAQYTGAQPSYTDNGDGTITDNITRLMWQQDPGDKMTFDQAVTAADTFALAGYDDWRLPTIKELYSLILFSGVDPSGWSGTDTSELVPFIDAVFAFEYGNPSAGERIIDSQFATSSKYVSTTMGGDDTDFGVNFADGRIKGYPTGPMPGQSSGKLYFVLYVRGNPEYGINDFVDNGDGTVTDKATGLTWTRDDSGKDLNWADALNYCEGLDLAGFDDWRLPNVKELQSILDYSRSPDTNDSAAIDPIFDVSAITSEAGGDDYPFYWSSTTHTNIRSGDAGSYVSFGRAWGYMRGSWLDVHGAGAQRSDPKSGDPAGFPQGRGPQGDAIRIYNHARCVRGGVSGEILTGGEIDQFTAPGPMQPGGDTGQPGGAPRKPPQEALDACSEASEGDACEINAPHGIVTGTCRLIEGLLACVPAGGPAGGGN